MEYLDSNKKIAKTISILLIIAFSFLLVIFSNAEAIDADSNPDILICLDPGHGGGDDGAIGAAGLLEKNINFDIAVRVKSKLQNHGYEVILTRYDDTYISDKERVGIAGQNQANIFVSIHNNESSLIDTSGTETFYSPDSSTAGRSLANYIQGELIFQLGSKNLGIKEKGFYVLNNTSMVSALVQGLFISNPGEEEKLKDRFYKDKISIGIADGIVNFISDFDISSYRAEINDLGSTPDFILPAEAVTINLSITNRSRLFTWPASGENAVSISYNIYNSLGETIVFDGSRTALQNDIRPGETVTVPVDIKVPAAGGSYIIEYDIVQEGVAWFSSRGNPAFRKDITITGSADEWTGTEDGNTATAGDEAETADTSSEPVEEEVPESDTGQKGSSGDQDLSDETGEEVSKSNEKYPNKKIIFVSDRDGGDSDLFISNLDGSGLTALTNNGVDDIYPTVSPDGTKIAYTSTIGGLWQIMIMNRDGTGQHQITSSGTLNAYPTWSADGKYIFYESKVDGVWEIYRINTDGTGNARLTYNPSADDWHPACHPTQPLVIFESGNPGNENIMAMDYNGQNMRNITRDTARNRTPDLSGTGELITFTRYNDGDGQVFIMDINGNNLRHITAMGGRNIHSTLSPDNKYISFDSSGGGKTQLYIFSFEDGVIRKVIDDSSHKYGDPFFLFY